MGRLRRVHAAFGLFMLLAFLASGAYMKFVAHPDRLPDRGHMMFVSRHIYILANALVHLALAAYITPARTRARGRMQVFGSGVLALSTLFLLSAFLVEAIGDRGRTMLSSFGLYALFGGVLVHFVSASLRIRRS